MKNVGSLSMVLKRILASLMVFVGTTCLSCVIHYVARQPVNAFRAMFLLGVYLYTPIGIITACLFYWISNKQRKSYFLLSMVFVTLCVALFYCIQYEPLSAWLLPKVQVK
jgi:hypothetical protein